MNVEEFIEHYGKKGMHWGVRKSRGSTKPSSGDHKRAAELKKRPRHSLTNKQLKTVNERSNLEQNFSKLNPGTIDRGTAKASKILATAGLGVAGYNLATSAAGKAAIAAGKRFLRIKKKGQLKLF